MKEIFTVYFQIMQWVLFKKSISRRTEQQSSYLHSRQVMGIKDWTLIKFHLSEVSFKKSFQLKVRGDTALGRGRKHKSKWEVSFHNSPISIIYKPTHLFILGIQTSADAFPAVWKQRALLKKHTAFPSLLLLTALLAHFIVLLCTFLTSQFLTDVHPVELVQIFESILTQHSPQKLPSKTIILCTSPPFLKQLIASESSMQNH